MGKPSRDKGQRGERLAVSKIYVAEGIQVVRLGNAGDLADLGGLEHLASTRRSRTAGVRTCSRGCARRWRRRRSITFRRCTGGCAGRGLTSPWNVNVTLRDFIDLLKEARGL
jgi:hypothetical protein